MATRLEERLFINPKVESESGKDSAFLSHKDVAILTGRKIKSYQVDQLRKMGIAFYVNAAGRPVVPRSSIEGRLQDPIKKEWEPNIRI